MPLDAPRSTNVRVGAAIAALVLAVAVPALFILGAVAPKRFQSLISTLLVVSIAVPLVLWFTSRRTRSRDDGPGGDGPGGDGPAEGGSVS